MKIINSRLFAVIGSLGLAALLAANSTAQPPEGSPRGPRGNRSEGGPGGPGGREGMRGDPKAMAQTMMERFDKDGDKMLNSDELVAALTEMRPPGGPVGFGGGPGGPGGPGGFGGPGGPGGFGGGPGAGGPGGGQMAGRMFEQNDKDGDGKLTGDEIPERMRQGMARIDSNADGSIDRAELEKVMSNWGGGRPRDGQPGDGQASDGQPGEGNRPRRPAAE